MKTLLLLLTGLVLSTAAYAGFGEIYGTVSNKQDGETLPGAAIRLFEGETFITGATTDVYGNYELTHIPSGTYTIEVSYVNMQAQKHTNITIVDGQQLKMNFEMESGVMETVVVEVYKGMVTPGVTGVVTILTEDQIETSAGVDVFETIALATPGVYQADSDSPLQVSGSRVGSTAYLVDGVRIVGEPTIIRNSIGQLQVYTGGVPAKYGDFTGGIVVIETKVYRLKMY